MPELPEVETVRKFLTEALLKPKAKKIKNIFIYYPGIIKEIDPVIFSKTLIGQTFSSVNRYGKYLILQLKTHSIISHLRMEGKYQFNPERSVIGKHDHVEFLMTDGSSLVFSDVRKFGTMNLVLKGTEMDHKSISKLGPEANDDSSFTSEHLEESCTRRTSSIKELLLDQEKVCGIGNIYADEILFAAGIHPESRAKNIPSEKLEDIVRESKYILDKAILNKGTTFRSFSSNNEEGEFQNCLKVYDRAGKECDNCGNKIEKIKVGGRGTHYCPKCQPKI